MRNNQNTWLTAKEASELLGYTPRHIHNLIKGGKVSATKGDDGHYYIEKSEFFRAFPDAFQALKERNEKKNEEKNTRNPLSSEVKYLKELIHEKEKFLNTLLSEKEKNNEFLKKQIEEITTEKRMLIDTLAANQRLIEHKLEEKKPRKKIFGIF